MSLGEQLFGKAHDQNLFRHGFNEYTRILSGALR
jgi:hypothetical protein